MTTLTTALSLLKRILAVMDNFLGCQPRFRGPGCGVASSHRGWLYREQTGYLLSQERDIHLPPSGGSLRLTFGANPKSSNVLPQCLVAILKEMAWVVDSLVVQWVRIYLAVQGLWVRSLVGELRFHKAWNN